ncbi:MAG: hypothetical protein M8364_16805 [Methylobacter sp.]|uniref:hypothetical protein n=1 Tax=Methylobacter sp. TaxID=2051955 RepID=UPI00258ABE0B|nr:hypothetical protein [Methylobacter sp.]MCL7422550.1 hypothetical protein [Methylobacter sp.]
MLTFDKKDKNGPEDIMIMAKFKLDDGTEYLAEDYIDGYLINPFLLHGSTPVSPFILRSDYVFSVHCLINGYLRCWGVFDNLVDALKCANKGASWRNGTYDQRPAVKTRQIFPRY